MTDRVRKLTRTITEIASLTLIMLLAFTATAWAAAEATPPDGSLIDLARPVLEALFSGKPGLAAALALVLAAAAARRYGGRRFAFLNTALGGAVLVLVGSFGGAAAALMTGGAALSVSLVWKALGVAVSAAGGYSLIKPVLRSLSRRAPAWMQPVFALIMWVFDKPDPVAAAVAEGDAAVAANPPAGSVAVTGAARDLK